MTIATREPGNSTWMRGATHMIPTTTSTAAMGHTRVDQSTCASPWAAATAALLLGPAATPNAAGTCCRKITTAIPTVKPSMTGHGMYPTSRPSFSAPTASTITPPSTDTTATAPTP